MVARNALLASLAVSASCRARSSSDRKSTRLNSSHSSISYAVFCLKKKHSNKHKSIIDHFGATPKGMHKLHEYSTSQKKIQIETACRTAVPFSLIHQLY